MQGGSDTLLQCGRLLRHRSSRSDTSKPPVRAETLKAEYLAAIENRGAAGRLNADRQGASQ